MTDIVLISWHRPKITELTIKTIHRNTKRDNYRLIVIDNGSSVEQQSMLSNLQDNGLIDELVLLDVNIGLEPARNMGLDLVRSKYFVCADNDCLPQPIGPSFTQDWLEQLIDLMEKHEGYGAISCRTPVMIGTGNIFDTYESEELVDFPHPGGSLRIMITDLVRAVGGWRDEVTGRGTEERYICGKIQEFGYRTAFAVQINCLHLFGGKDSDRWGYEKGWKPEDTGHSDIFHPKLEQGDDPEEVQKYTGKELAREYFNEPHSSNT